jgi:phosphoribosylformylglycinamidine cyclo-ligase
VNDIAVQGAVPLFFLDYYAVGKLDAAVAAAVVSGLARGCKANGCALIGGETAEMPGSTPPANTTWRASSSGRRSGPPCSPARSSHPATLLLGLPSTGLHTNGYSLARKLFFETAGYNPTARPGTRRHRGRRTVEGPPQLPAPIRTLA